MISVGILDNQTTVSFSSKGSLAKEPTTALQDLMYVELWSPESSTTTWEPYSMIKEATPALRDTCIPQSTAVASAKATLS